jgi:hypothetical protein
MKSRSQPTFTSPCFFEVSNSTPRRWITQIFKQSSTRLRTLEDHTAVLLSAAVIEADVSTMPAIGQILSLRISTPVSYHRFLVMLVAVL